MSPAVPRFLESCLFGDWNQTDAGEICSKALIDEHPSAKIVAIGKTSSRILQENNVRHLAVRHPAYGGKNEFQSGLSGILTDCLGYPPEILTITKVSEQPLLFPGMF